MGVNSCQAIYYQEPKMPLQKDCCCISQCTCQTCQRSDCSGCCDKKTCCTADDKAKLNCCSVEARIEEACCCGPSSDCCATEGTCSCKNVHPASPSGPPPAPLNAARSRLSL